MNMEFYSPKEDFINKKIKSSLVFLVLLLAMQWLTYVLNEPVFINLSKVLMFTMAFYLVINALTTRHITQNAFLSYLSLFYGLINLLQVFQLVLPNLNKFINFLHLSMATFHIGRTSFAFMLIILSYTYVYHSKHLEKVSLILFIAFIVVTSSSMHFLVQDSFYNFATSPTIGALIFNLFNNLIMIFAMSLSIYWIYPVRHQFPKTHLFIMSLFIGVCFMMDFIQLVYFIPLSTPIILPYTFKVSTLYLLILGQIDCCMLRPFAELYFQHQLTSSEAASTHEELYKYSTYAKQLESNLNTITSQYERLLSIFTEPFLLCSDGIILDANTAALSLFDCTSKHDLIGSPLFNYLKLNPDTYETYTHLPQSPNTILTGEGKLRTLEKDLYDVEYLFTTAYLKDHLKTVCILKNISSEKQKLAVEAALEQQNLKLTYFSNVSHDIKMPINIIYSALQMQQNAVSREECLHYTTMMKSNALKLMKLITNVLDITKIENNMIRFSSETFNLVDAVETLCEISSYYMKDKDITYIFDTDNDEKLIHTDPAAFERIIFNLISNAIKYTPQNGHIDVYIEDLGEEVNIKISDTGIGIPPEKMEHIFDRFVTVYDGISSKEHSSGIGLSIVSDLVHIMGGTIKCDSTLNTGSTFTITLPTPTIEDVCIDMPYQTAHNEHNIKVEFCDI